MIRKDVLAEAAVIVSTDRATEYGPPEDNFAAIARLWRAHLHNRYSLDLPLDGVDAALMLDLLKTARLARNPSHRDSWVDKAGYAACGAEVALKQSSNHDG